LDNGAYVQMDPNATSVTLNGVEGGEHHLTIRATDSLNGVLVSETNFTVGASTTSSVTDAFCDPVILGIIGIVAIAAIGGAYYFLRKKKA
jgi:LPXTG-motif cell wall-anchored protein